MSRLLHTSVPYPLLAVALCSLAAAQSDLELLERTNATLGLRESRVVRLDLPAGGPGEVLSIPLEFRGQGDLIQLAPHSVRAEGEFRVLAQLADGSWSEVDPGAPRTYRGTLVGEPGSVVAASLLDDGLHARVRLAEGEDWWLQPLVALVPGAPFDAHVLYATSAVLDQGHTCGADLLVNDVPEPPAGGGGTYAPGSSVKIAQLGCDADFEYHNLHGGVAGATAAIETVINAMNPQYEFEVDITHVITAILVRTSSNQPYTSTDPGTLLNQFRNEWVQNQGGITRDVAELFTGKNLDGSVIGIAWIGQVCKSLGYNVVQHLSSLTSRTDLSAHELGHNWNASHCTCGGYTMNPSLTSANRFHGTFSEPTIRNYRNSVNCLTSSSGTPLFEDGFESGNLAAGGWTTQNSLVGVKGGAARSGLYGANLRRTTWLQKAQSTVGFSQITLVFTWKVVQYESGEQVVAEWSGDGGATWNQVASTVSKAWGNNELVLPAAAAGKPGFRLRFRTNAVGKNSVTGKTKKAHIDVVRIVGN